MDKYFMDHAHAINDALNFMFNAYNSSEFPENVAAMGHHHKSTINAMPEHLN
jgi:hypothetical protein